MAVRKGSAPETPRVGYVAVRLDWCIALIKFDAIISARQSYGVQDII
jgi:hypothetical protein